MRIILVFLIVGFLMLGIAAVEGESADFSEDSKDEDIKDFGHGNPGYISPVPNGGGNGGGGAPG